MARKKLAPSEIKIELMLADQPSDAPDIISELFDLLLSFADIDELSAD